MHLVRVTSPWPRLRTLGGVSPYRSRFRQGASIVPRRFWFVERVLVGRLGPSPSAPLVQGRTGGQDKLPWKNVAPPRGPVEARFLRSVLAGENFAPFRLLPPTLCVVPVNESGALLNAAQALREGAPRLSDWLTQVEGLWNLHASTDVAGKPKMTLGKNINHMQKLTQQWPMRPLRVIHARSGTLLCSAIVTDPNMIIDSGAYWVTPRSMEEARYLTAILNCERLRLQITDLQSKGQGVPAISPV